MNIAQIIFFISFKGRMDIVGAAETGSGKTLAFGIPIVQVCISLIIIYNPGFIFVSHNTF